MIKDFLGNEITIGDEVVYMEIRYRTLKRGFIASISPKKLRIVDEMNEFSLRNLPIRSQRKVDWRWLSVGITLKRFVKMKSYVALTAGKLTTLEQFLRMVC